MTSVTENALSIYLEAREKARELAAKDGMACTIDMPFAFKGRGMKSKISISADDMLYITTEDKNVVKGNYRFSKDHMLTRYLLQNADWDERPKEVELELKSSKTLDVNSLNVKKIKYKDHPWSDLLEASYDSLSFTVPIKSVGALDTVFYMYTDREPVLEDFATEEMIKDRTAEADIRTLPTLPGHVTPPDIKTKEGCAFPVERIVRNVENYRKRAIERYRRARSDIKSVAGEYPTEISCGMETEFLDRNGFQFSARVAKPKLLGPWLNSAKIKFPSELPLDAIGYQLNGRFGNGLQIRADANDYLNAKSVLDLIEKSKLTVKKSKFEITNDMVLGNNLHKRDIRKMFDLATKVSSIGN